MSLPLSLPAYFLNTTAIVQVTIVYNYYTANVFFYNNTLLVYNTTLMDQEVPKVTLPTDLQIGTFVIHSGTLTLKIPTSYRQGTVTLNCTYTDTGVTEPQNLDAVIASWDLNQ